MENRRRIVLDVALWIIALFLVSVFIRQGIAKFSDTSGCAQAFRQWHFPVWFRLCIGVAETAAALLLLSRRTASGGAIIIIAVMLGAMGTHIWWGVRGRLRAKSCHYFWQQLWRSVGANRSFCIARWRAYRECEREGEGKHRAVGRNGTRCGWVFARATLRIHTTRGAIAASGVRFGRVASSRRGGSQGCHAGRLHGRVAAAATTPGCVGV